MIRTALYLLIFLFIWLGSGPLFAQGGSLYVGLQGSDESGDGSAERPFRTLPFAAKQAQPGTTIYVQGGVYEEQLFISAQGTADQPITITPVPGESVRFDGQQLDIPEDQNIVMIEFSAHLIFEGFEIANSSGRGLGVFESEHVIFRNNRVHHIEGRGIGGGGDHIIIEENEVWLTSLENEYEAFNAIGGWKAGISTYTRADDTPSTNFVIRNNHIHDIWGEGIIALFVDGAIIEGNEVHDTYSVNIYIDNSRRVSVLGNYLYATTTRFNRNDRLYPANGIHMANEAYAVAPDTQLDEILIANNLIVGTGRGISYWYDQRNLSPSNSYKNVTIVNNVIKDTHDDAIRFESVGLTAVSPQNVLVQNNIIFAGGNGQALNIANPDSWTFANNNWPDGVPALAAEPHSFAAPPRFFNPTGSLAPEDFQLQPDSTSIGSGRPFPALTVDFWGAPRHTAFPSLGIFEPQTDVLQTAVSPTSPPSTSAETVADAATPEATSSSPETAVEPPPLILPTAAPAPASNSGNPSLLAAFIALGVLVVIGFVWLRRSR